MPLNPRYALFSSMLYYLLSSLFLKTMPPVMHLEIFLAENQVNYDYLCCYLTKKFQSKHYMILSVVFLISAQTQLVINCY